MNPLSQIATTSTSALISARRQFQAVLPADSLRGRFARGSAWAFVANMASRVFSLASVILVVRLLGKETYGEFSILQRTIAMFGLFGCMGLGTTATKFVSQYHRTDPEKAGRVLGLSLLCVGATSAVVCAICFVLAPWLADAVLDRPALSPLLRIGSVVLLLSAVANVLTGALAGFEAFKEIAGIHFFQGVVRLVIVWPLVWFWGIRGALAWLILDTVTLSSLAATRLRRCCCLRGIQCSLRKVTFDEVAVVWRFAIPVTFGGLVIGPVMWVTSAMLANQPEGYGQLGLYNAAFQWRAAVVLFPGIFGAVFLPILTSIPSDQVLRRRRVLVKSFVLCVACATSVAAVICVLKEPLLGLYGREFIQGKGILVIVMVASVLSAANEILYHALLAEGKPWWRLLSNGIWAVVFVAASMFLVPTMQGKGLAIALLGAGTIHLLVQAIMVVRHSWTSVLDTG
jgi:O-antigen/teichoic acid export membrane protein